MKISGLILVNFCLFSSPFWPDLACAQSGPGSYAIYLLEQSMEAQTNGDEPTMALLRELALRADPERVKIPTPGIHSRQNPTTPKSPTPRDLRDTANPPSADVNSIGKATPAAKPTFPFDRTLKDGFGREIDATVLGLSSNGILFRRKSDAVEFDFPISRLSPSDQEFFRNLARFPAE